MDDAITQLKDLEQRLRAQAAPVRERVRRLGPAGLYAMAAQDLAWAEQTSDPLQRELHLKAARAAEKLADRALTLG